ncbi:MAG: Hsp33 family molecular chaperone HslO [Pseudomonadota bacterium]
MSDVEAPESGNPIFDNNDNIIQSFQLEESNLRGRIVRLGSVLDEILEPHNYPEAVNQLVGETLALSALLSSMLKYEGVFTLQAQGDGPISMLVSDMTSAHKLRGCASFNAERLSSAMQQLSDLSVDERSQNQLAQLLGKGYLAFTVDQGEHAERYQGIVDLQGASLVDCVQHYFAQSEQIGTGIKMAVGQRDGKWRAAGIMVQNMPEDDVRNENWSSNLNEDDWRRTMILLDSCTRDEFLSPELGENMLLMRLFHEEGVRIFPPEPITKDCRCSTDRVEQVLSTLSEDDLDHITEDGKITMTCEFCSRDFIFDDKVFRDKIKMRLKTEPENTSTE